MHAKVLKTFAIMVSKEWGWNKGVLDEVAEIIYHLQAIAERTTKGYTSIQERD